MKIGDWCTYQTWGSGGYVTHIRRVDEQLWKRDDLEPLTVEDAFRLLGDAPEGAKIVSYQYGDDPEKADDRYWSVIDGGLSVCYLNGGIANNVIVGDFERHGIPLNRLPVDAEVFELLPKVVQEKLEGLK